MRRTFAPSLDAYDAAITLAMALREILNNPMVIDEAAEKALQAQFLVEEKKKQIADAEASIEETKRLYAQLMQDKEAFVRHMDEEKLKYDWECKELAFERSNQELINSVANKNIYRQKEELKAKEAELFVKMKRLEADEIRCRDWHNDLTKKEEKLNMKLANVS